MILFAHGLSRSKTILLAIFLLTSFYLLFSHVRPAVYHHAFQQTAQQSHHESVQYSPEAQISNISINLVVATLAADDISWTSTLPIPNLNIIRYESDSPFASFHPPVARGREALIYHTYLHDFYDDLPDISIFIHSHENPWHVDPALRQSMTFALSQLDVHQVMRKQYFNLRVSWKDACPAWINTTKTPEESIKQEEPFMAEAFHANFGHDVPVPEILAGPCCSQFAVTRDAIQRRSKEEYKRYMEWLVNTDWSDYISGRVWEHMWPWLFLEEAEDCTPEFEALCRMYAICFEGPQELEQYQRLWQEKDDLKERTEFVNELLRPGQARSARMRMDTIGNLLERKLEQALRRGRSAGIRQQTTKDLPW
ncbi:Hypothetical predicted protein [Lecanosticta acicola]|uniref:Uncharacterized protein n=1 Tax=Lecanosticta acicola TaxID=111012 RepID=A0AAI8Z4E0_9PEZI|nr:Hypothetical predicted protein [Lecanosticta acicola]